MKDQICDMYCNKARLSLHRHIDINTTLLELEDLKVLRRSPDLLNNVKIGQG